MIINLPVLKLLNSYYIKGFFGPFFLIVFPFLLMFILGNAFYQDPSVNPIAKTIMHAIVGGVLVTTIISVGLFNIPVMIIDFKKSTLIKRIGAARISKFSFLFTILAYQFALMLFATIWILFWAGVFIGTKKGFDWSIAFPSTIGLSIPFLLFAFVLSLSLGIMIVAVSKTIQAVYGITNLVYLPVAFFSGSFIPKTSLDSSSILTAISYALPTKYVVDPFFAAWNNGIAGLDAMGWERYGYPLIAIAFTLLMFAITVKKFKWN